MEIKMTIKKNIPKLITAIIFIIIGVTSYCIWILFNSKTNITTIIQFLGITVALIVGIITALFSWNNTQNLIENNEKQLLIVGKYELLLGLNIKLQTFELQSKNNPPIGETNFNNKDYSNYLTLIYLQNILKTNKKVFMILFPRTLLYYTQFRFIFTQNLSSILPNKNQRILIELFKVIFEKTEDEQYSFINLNYIEYPEMISLAFPSLRWIDAIYNNSEENLKDYQNGIKLFFKYLNYLIESFNKEFKEQKINYELY